MSLLHIWTIPACTVREKLHRTADWGLRWVAHLMPRRLAYWVLIDVGVKAIEQMPPTQVVPEVTFFDVLERTGEGVNVS